MTNAPPREPAEREQWEYYVARFGNLPDMRDVLDVRGREGWEAVNISALMVAGSGTGEFATSVSSEWTVLMKRRLR